MLNSSLEPHTGDELNAQASSRCESQGKKNTAHLDTGLSSLYKKGLLIHTEYVVVMGCHVTVFSDLGIKIWGRGCLLLN